MSMILRWSQGKFPSWRQESTSLREHRGGRGESFFLNSERQIHITAFLRLDETSKRPNYENTRLSVLDSDPEDINMLLNQSIEGEIIKALLCFILCSVFRT